jgi:hypothetical protein
MNEEERNQLYDRLATAWKSFGWYHRVQRSAHDLHLTVVNTNISIFLNGENGDEPWVTYVLWDNDRSVECSYPLKSLVGAREHYETLLSQNEFVSSRYAHIFKEWENFVSIANLAPHRGSFGDQEGYDS